MKYIIVTALLMIGCTKEVSGDSEYKKRRNVALEFARTMEVGECFRYEDDRKAKHTFERNYKMIDHIHVVMAKDSRGLMVAQPEPDCRAKPEESHGCEYWFRTVPFDNLYLFHAEDVKVKCPSELSMPKMIERLKKSQYSNRYSF